MIPVKQQVKQTKALFVCLLLFIAHAYSQDNVVAAIQQQFDQYRQKTLQEKIFVHTDKNFYLAGEILWFKLYNVDATQHTPVDISKVAYVEILDNANKPVLQAKVGLKDGAGNGSLQLPVTLNTANYKLRAYTNWMKNYGADQFYEKTVTIVNSQKTADQVPGSAKKNHYDIHFFPEGGNLVAGLESKLAFKVTDAYGKGATFRGAVIDERNDTVARLQPERFGMGNFSFTPGAGHTYRSVIGIAGADKLVQELPAVYKEGYVMHVADEGKNNIVVTVRTNLANAGEVYLFAHTRGSVKVTQQASVRNGMAAFTIDKNRLGDGISSFTVFNGNRQPVCERLYFKYPENKLQLGLKTDQPSYAARAKVTIDIQTADQTGKTQSAGMSIAVYRLDSLQTVDESAINSYLWLTSDLTGNIESPEYYFTAAGNAAIDDLMLTNGWRRFRWEDVLTAKTPAFTYVPEYNGHLIYGKVVYKQTGTPAANISSYLSVPGMRTQFVPSSSDASGRVKFEMKDMYGSSEIIVQTNPLVDSIYRIDIDNPFFCQYSNTMLPDVQFPRMYANTILDRSIGVQVQNIYGSQKLKQFSLPATVDTNAFFLKPDATYYLDNYTRFLTLEEVLREYVTFIDIRRHTGKFHLPMYDLNSQALFTEDPLVLVDGVPIFDLDRFMSYDPLKIRKLETVNTKYIYGNHYFQGILNWITYKGNLANFEMDPRMTVIDYEGLQAQREFYSPVYDDAQKVASHLPDFRNVLYWSPDIYTNAQGRQQVNFYSSDMKGKYAIVLQGLSQDGKCGSNVSLFEVK